jgi:CheY-like chemotaxis protein/HPt (histidine-containing phosphotransfer) domain-containing protein
VRFAVCLDAAPGEPTVARDSGEALRGKRVLVVDDRGADRKILIDYLAGAGALVEGAASAAHALDRLERAAGEGRPFALALIDMVMPGSNGLELATRLRTRPALADLALIMVTSRSWNGDASGARRLGISRLLSKPVRRGDLLQAASAAISADAPATPPVRAAAQRPRFAARVLVAEDNPVNEEVAREFLTTMGCEVIVVRNGHEAVAAARDGGFDVILMDCQMPEMDGLTATRDIRRIEAENGRARTPIVAVTANAFAEDRAMCMAHGMDDYLSKPYTETHLAAAIERWAAPTRRVGPAPGGGRADMVAPDIDDAALAEIRAARPRLLARLLTTYLAHAPGVVDDLARAIASGNAAALKIAAHSLKSSSANVGARRIAALSKELEVLAGAGNVAEAASIARALETEFAAVQAAFDSRLQAVPSG